MKKTEIAQLFLLIHNAYPNTAMDETKISLWQEFLGDIPFEQAKRNLLQHIRISAFQPTPADVLRFADDKPYNALLSPEETQERLRLMDEWAAKASPPPPRLSDGRPTWVH